VVLLGVTLFGAFGCSSDVCMGVVVRVSSVIELRGPLLGEPHLLLPHPSHHITSSHVTSRHVTSRHVTSRHVTSRHVTSRHVTSHHITSHHLHTPSRCLHASSPRLTPPLFSLSVLVLPPHRQDAQRRHDRHARRHLQVPPRPSTPSPRCLSVRLVRRGECEGRARGCGGHTCGGRHDVVEAGQPPRCARVVGTHTQGPS
jgi:hypothetical protein